MTHVENEIREFLASNFMLQADASELAPDASLTATGVIDSMGVLELIMFLEEQFGLSVPDEDAVPEHLDSVAGIVRYVELRQGGRAV